MVMEGEMVKILFWGFACFYLVFICFKFMLPSLIIISIYRALRENNGHVRTIYSWNIYENIHRTSFLHKFLFSIIYQMLCGLF